MLGKAFKFQLKKENQDVKSGGKGSGKDGKKAEGKKDSKKQASKEEEKTKVCYVCTCILLQEM